MNEHANKLQLCLLYYSFAGICRPMSNCQNKKQTNKGYTEISTNALISWTVIKQMNHAFGGSFCYHIFLEYMWFSLLNESSVILLVIQCI